MAHDRQFPEPAATWDQRFSQPGYVFGTEPNAFLASQRALFEPGKRALAVADGEGRNSVWLARQGLAVDAFDISPVGVDKARELARQGGVAVNYQVSDCDGWNWEPQAYDYVVAIFIQFADPAMRERLFANMARALKPGGYLVLQGYTPKQLDYNTGGPGILEHLYTPALLREAFADLEMVELREYEAQLSEGSRHIGPSALIGMVARRR
ncbi:class I SAM-dependent methyltransferase [Massilia agilis]|uniref:Class I SAM-dependent methyltransferase n=1 Tax=Massilia agilis TaxID=1811226 RepID=A0ABT2D5K7_9BURK|nr:class I SAM-dependent methyltransferase [Massilia agilis]MCS0806432.1 class I SAM-dependent methyltransferase [Massilia agilis]